ncbi:voltage-dependent calcium channel subunit alpha-2/delta-2-like [Babylonia areolata]|uniref:voltage-dependent calcium channel subunit alpha-2/delta-2-like n=1 Tax=Babylonia areolata TaxID=304850 RepID=UPI003FD1F896
MKNAVKSILDTLGENDFVNIVEFNQEADFVSDCFNHTAFVQANYRNKKQLEKDVEELKAQGQADYQVGLRFAFQKFQEFSQNSSDGDVNVGANCNKVIILLTDGGTDNAEEVFKEYNWPNKTVRVFTYAVGPTATPVAAIRWMACANRGYFSQIPAMGAIRARVQDYLVVMGRPLALAYAENTQWTSGHKSPLSDNPAGLGMMTTVTLPVYNRTLGSSNQTILGVMGIDVPTTELGKHTPFVEIGPVGYAFAINPNGYAVFHPNLKHTGRYMKDPPNIDLMELELEKVTSEDDKKDGVENLRNRMIEGSEGPNSESPMQIPDGLFLSPNKKYVSLHKATYAITNILNTTFRLGLSVPSFQRKYPYFDTSSLPDIDASSISDEMASLHIAPWEYFGTIPETFPKKLGLALNNSLESLVNILKNGNITAGNLTEGQLQMLHHLAISVKACHTVRTYGYLLRRNSSGEWTNQFGEQKDVELLGFPLEEVPIHFMAFNGGLTAVYPADKSSFMEKDFDLTNSTYYKRAMYADEYILMPVMNESTPLILAARSIVVQSQNHRIGATGVVMTAEGFRNFTFSALMNATLLHNSRRTTYTCEDVDSMVCYVVDDGGFLVTSNLDNATIKAGSFLGQVDPQLWNYLRSEQVYGQAEQFDFQAMCKVQKDTTSAGHSAYFVPSINMLYETLTVSWWTSKVTWALTSLNVYNWLFGSAGVHGEDDGGGDEDGDMKEEDCVLATRQYYLLRERANISAAIPCDTGSRQVVTQTTTKTNLMLIVAELPCDSMDVEDRPVYSEPRRISKEEERKQVCRLSRHPRPRVQSYGCYDNDPNEDDTKCGAAAMPGGRLVALVTAWVTVGIICLLTTDPR